MLNGAVLEREAEAAFMASELAALVAGNTGFGLELLARTGVAVAGGNGAVAPYSVSQALGMV